MLLAVNHASSGTGAGMITQTVIASAVPAASGTIENLPTFKDVPMAEHQSLFLRKLQVCCHLFDFNDTVKMVREKEIKRQTLVELVDCIQSSAIKISETNQEEMIKMISINIFRCLPAASHVNTSSINVEPDPEEEEQFSDPHLQLVYEFSWPHLQLVYELLIHIIYADTELANRFIEHSFLLNLLELFESEDSRERVYLKLILHRIYKNFMVHRPYIRRAINNIFYRFIHVMERHCGIGELLEIWGCIIDGFALPMKEEHKLSLVRAFMPLHKMKRIQMYHHRLSYCTLKYVQKDYKLADTVIRGLLKYWPVSNSKKEVLFLGELEAVLKATQAAEFQRCMVPLFRQVAHCLSSLHFEVAKRSLFLWNNEHIMTLVFQNRNVILPITFEALEKNIRGHWNQLIRQLTVKVCDLFLKMDANLFEDCQKQFAEKAARASELDKQRALRWQRLEAAASRG